MFMLLLVVFQQYLRRARQIISQSAAEKLQVNSSKNNNINDNIRVCVNQSSFTRLSQLKTILARNHFSLFLILVFNNNNNNNNNTLTSKAP